MDIKKSILKYLELGEQTSSNISTYLKKHYYIIVKYLEELEYDNKITKEVKPNKQTYWKLR